MARDSSGTKNEPQYAATGAPADAADLTELGAYAALVGNRKALTSAQRLALTGNDVWNGLEVQETDTGLIYLRHGGQWRLLDAVEETGAFALGSLYQNHSAWDALALTRRGKRVRLRGTATINQTVTFAGSFNYVLGTVPVGWRPGAGLQALRAVAFSPLAAGFVFVSTAGDITFSMSTGGTYAANAWLIGLDLEWFTA